MDEGKQAALAKSQQDKIEKITQEIEHLFIVHYYDWVVNVAK